MNKIIPHQETNIDILGNNFVEFIPTLVVTLFYIKKEPLWGIGMRAGFGAFEDLYSGLFATKTLISVPLEAYVSRGKRFCGELGLGCTYIYKEKDPPMWTNIPEEEKDTDHFTPSIRFGGKFRGDKGILAFGGGLRCNIFNQSDIRYNPYNKSDISAFLYVAVGYSF